MFSDDTNTQMKEGPALVEDPGEYLLLYLISICLIFRTFVLKDKSNVKYVLVEINYLQSSDKVAHKTFCLMRSYEVPFSTALLVI